MLRTARLVSSSLLSVAVSLASACDGFALPVGDGANDGPGDAGEGEGEGEGEGNGPAVDDVVSVAATALCDALYRCCPSDEELARFFAPVSGSDPAGVFADLIPRVPPQATLPAEDCPAVVAEIHSLKGIGPFARAATAGELAYDSDAAQACLDTLASATCGDAVIDALFDGTCFSLSPPFGGAEQRSMFHRTATGGECHPLADGFGGILYGTCDPTTSFCCIDAGNGECGLGGVDAVGTCAGAAQEGEACAHYPPLQLCATGLECIPGAGPEGGDGCAAPLTESLAEGDPCYDDSAFQLLGDCVDGWCDATGSNVCERRRADGEDCQTADQCISLGCVEGLCGIDDFCSGG
jgi:hypothetical protein